VRLSELPFQYHRLIFDSPGGIMPDDPTPSAALSPVHDHPGDPQQPTDGIALCMSGGGYRAMLFHLGTLWRLNELRYLPKLDRVSSVSGGSITNGVLALNWTKLGFDSNGFAANFEQQVTQPVRRLAAQSIDISSVITGLFGGVAKKVADHYNQFLFNHAKLQDLPDAPRFVFNATSLQTGVLWRFSKPYMGDYKVGLVKTPDLELASAVAGSSAFPPVLSPLVLHLDPNSFDNNSVPPPQITDPAFRKQIVLADGGVYDNLGLETAWKRYKTVLISDGGAALEPESDPAQDWAGQTSRVLEVIYNQVGALRKRTVVALYINGVRNGSYWGITANIVNYQLPDALVCPFDVTTKLAETATRLSAMDDQLQQQIIDWGYAVCDAAMRKHVLPPGAPAPAASPYGIFRKP
jgi:NTE family protein